MKSKNVRVIIFAIVIIAIVSVPGIFSYLTDAEAVSNVFVVGEVKIDLQEPKWESSIDSNDNGIPDYAENIVPNATIVKDPQIKNTGNNNAYVYIKVKVPAKKVVVADSNGKVKNEGNPTDTQLFTYDVNNDWKEIVSARKDNLNDSNEIESYTYVYYYDKELKTNEITRNFV